MTKLTPGRLVLGAIGLAVGVAAVLALREATLSTHEPVAGDGIELVVSPRPRAVSRTRPSPEMVEAQLLTCRLEVTSDLDGPIESLGDGRFRAVLTPAMDETNHRQFRGCVEDLVIDHVQIDVIELSVVR